MAYPDDFLQAHGATVLTVAVVLLTLLTAFHMSGVSFAEPKDEVVDKVVTIETMAQKGSTPDTVIYVGGDAGSCGRRGGLTPNLKPQWAGHACARYSSQPHLMEAYCTKLSDSGCAAMDCCLWLNGERCAAGDQDGPTFHNVDIKYYRFKDKCTGNCPAKIE
tara:strand:- start:474 stop:959 length:486 start_codon:yes stop_codon:yes gene_type:complete